MSQFAPLIAPGQNKDSNTSVVVVVDPLSSGRYLVAELLKRGENLVAVQSSQNISAFLSKALEPDREALRSGKIGRFLGIFDHIDDEDVVADNADQDAVDCYAELRLPNEEKDADDNQFITSSAHVTLECIKKAGFHVRAIVGGSEPGVPVAEQLQAAMGFKDRNSVRTSMVRRDKYPMQEALRKSRLRAIKQNFAKSPEEVFNWMKNEDMEFPLILKPATGAASEGVRKCHNAEDVEHAFRAECASGKVNICGIQNAGLIAQEFLQGTEYVVDSISCGKGKHAVVAFWKYRKMPDLTYEYARLIESSGEVQDSLRSYIAKVLDAVGIYYGASHAEVIMTNDGPCLVEVGARMHGTVGPSIMRDATGFGIHEFLADLTIGGQAAERVHELVKKDWRYQLVKHAYYGQLNNRPEWHLTGTLQEEIGAFIPGIDEKVVSDAQAGLNFLNLHPTAIRQFHAAAHKGDQLQITSDLLSSPGVFVVIHESEHECEAAIQAVRKAERAMLAHAIGVTDADTDAATSTDTDTGSDSHSEPDLNPSNSNPAA